MPPRRAGRSVNRKSTPVSPPKGSNVTSPTQGPRKRSTRSVSRELTDEHTTAQLRHKNPGLSAVNEEQNVIDPALQDLVGDEPAETDSFAPASDELSYSSTAVTSPSRVAFFKLDRQAMLDALSDLLTDSTGVIAVFINPHTNLSKLWADIHTPGSRLATRLGQLALCLNTTLEPFRQHASLDFIDTQACRRRLLQVPYGGHAPSAPADPHAILCQANIATLLSQALSIRPYTPSAEKVLQKALMGFPRLFLRDIDPSSNGDGRDETGETRLTYELGLELRTQYLLSRLRAARRDAGFDPDHLLRLAFHNSDGQLHALGGAEDDVLPGEYHNLFLRRMHSIRNHFKTTGDFVNFEALEGDYSWFDFLAHLVKWSQVQVEQIRAEVNAQSGVEAMQDYLRKLPAPSATDDDTGFTPITAPTSVAPVKARKKGGSVLGDQPGRLHNRLARAEAQKAAAQAAAANASEQAEVEDLPLPTIADVLAPVQNDNDQVDRPLRPAQETISIRPTQQTAAILQVKRAHELQSNKENLGQEQKGKARAAYVDRQPNAHRIGWDDTQDVGGPSTAAAKSPGKRKRPVDADDEDEEAFENDTRPVTKKRPRAALLQDDGDALDDFRAGDEDDQHQGTAGVRRMASTQPRTALPPQRSLSSAYRPAASAPQERAPALSAPAPPRLFTQITRPTQQRMSYTEAEQLRLIQLIEEHGTSWSKLLEIDRDWPVEDGGPQLQERSQVQLKDKARNLKMDYLKGGTPLPTNFDRVALGNRLIGKLDDMGIVHSER